MSKTIKKNFTVTPEEWELAKQKSLIKFGYINVSGYLRSLIVSDETFLDGFEDLTEFKKYK